MGERHAARPAGSARWTKLGTIGVGALMIAGTAARLLVFVLRR